MPAIEINHLTKKYGDHTAVYDLCLNIEEGELFSLLGVNGAGKTTTIKMLSCLLRPTNGDALLHGKSIAANPMLTRKKWRKPLFRHTGTAGKNRPSRCMVMTSITFISSCCHSCYFGHKRSYV